MSHIKVFIYYSIKKVRKLLSFIHAYYCLNADWQTAIHLFDQMVFHLHLLVSLTNLIPLIKNK
jgi:hypothetical protein